MRQTADQAFWQASPDWLALFRRAARGAWRYVDLNPATEQGYRMARAEVIGADLRRILGDAAAALPLRVMERVHAGRMPGSYAAVREIGGAARRLDVRLAPAQGGLIMVSARDFGLVVPPPADWQARARRVGLLQATLAELVGCTETWVSLGIRLPVPPAPIRQAIVSWELLTPPQRFDLLTALKLRRRPRQRLFTACPSGSGSRRLAEPAAGRVPPLQLGNA